MDQNNKKYAIIAVVALILIGSGIYFYYRSENSKPPTAPVINEVSRNFEILSVENYENYTAKDFESGKEVKLIIPSGANFIKGNIESIKVGSKIGAERILEAANGIVVTQLSVY